ADRGVPEGRRPHRPAAGLDRAARVSVARSRRDPVGAGGGRGGRAARRARAALAAVRPDALLRGVSGQPDAHRPHLRGRRARAARVAARPGLPPLRRRERPRRERAGGRRRARADGGAAGLPGALPQLVERAAGVADRAVDRPRRVARLLARAVPVDGGRGSRGAGRAQDAGRRGAPARLRPCRRARAARRRLLRRRLRPARGRLAGRVAGRRRGSARPDRVGLALDVSWPAEGFETPQRLDLETGHHLRPIRAADVDIDYPAVMGSRASLWARYGEAWGWPPETMTAEQDRE